MGRLNLRRRTLDPSICLDEELAGLGPWQQLLFERLPMIADRRGRLEDRPATIRAVLFPYSDIPVDEFLADLARPRTLSPGGFILRYAVDGRKYIQIRSFERYQKPHYKEDRSEIPEPTAVNLSSADDQSIMDLGSNDDTAMVESSSHPDPDPDPDPEERTKTAPRTSPESRELETPLQWTPGDPFSVQEPPIPPEILEPPLKKILTAAYENGPPLVLTAEEPPAELEKTSNPYTFVAFWQDANAERDFSLRFEPENGFTEFLEAELERLELSARSRTELGLAVSASMDNFRGTYAKRTGRAPKRGGPKKTRGGSLPPTQLTEELVAWVRKDLNRLRSRAPTRPAGGLKSVDEAIHKSVTRGRQIDQADGKGKGSNKWQPRKVSRRPSRG